MNDFFDNTNTPNPAEEPTTKENLVEETVATESEIQEEVLNTPLEAATEPVLENSNDSIPQENSESQEKTSEPFADVFEENKEQSIPVYNPVNYSPVTPVNDYKPMSRGLKVFSLILVLIIALTGTSLGGYFIGKSGVTSAKYTSAQKVDLAAKPKNTDELTCAQVYEKVNPSIVGITVYNASGEGGQASGIVYSKDGYIVTNDHIYSEIPNAKFKIHSFDGKDYDATYVAGDVISDLAILKVENSKLKPAVFGNSDELYEGQNVVAIGRPSDATDTSSITKGIISALNRRVSNTSNYSARLIQTDTPINPGSSGGSLVNMYGQVVGVTASKLASVDIEGVGYAIPTTVMKRIVEELISKGKVVSRAKLGITYMAVNSVLAEMNNYKHTGLLVDSVSEDSDLYGKIQKNDMITHINNIEIKDDDMVLDIIEQCSAGDTITVTVITSKGKTQTLSAKLKANIGESSYTTKESESKNPANSDNSGPAFEFPIGE